MFAPVTLTSTSFHTTALDARANRLAGFPESLDSNAITTERAFKSSTRVWSVTIDGNRYILKAAKENEVSQHMRAEYEAMKSYAALGVPVPQAQCYEVDSGFTFPDGSRPEGRMPVILMEYLEGEMMCDVLHEDFSSAETIYKELAKHAYIDMLLGNGDVPGLLRNNAIKKDDKWYRIDFGNAFEYNVDGKLKSALPYLKPKYHFVSGKMGELDLFMDSYFKLFSFDIVSQLTFSDLVNQARELDITNLSDLVTSGNLSQERFDIIEARHTDFMRNCDAYFNEYEPIWKERKEKRLDALAKSDTKRLVPDFSTNSMEAIAVAHGLHQPAWAKQGTIGDARPLDPVWAVNERQNAVVGLVLHELGSNEIILTIDNKLPTAPIKTTDIDKGRVQNPVMKATFSLGRSAGFRVGVTGDSITNSQERDTTYRFYSAARAGGSVDQSEHYKRVSLEEALTLVKDSIQLQALNDFAEAKKNSTSFRQGPVPMNM
ncbi:MAG: phosphotransferase [Chlamydiales bacterium]|nr:phosphotransferase [Chlamydiia bacterium]MCP5508592.1 phosphotransferase [Chlamydiales bacterium]